MSQDNITITFPDGTVKQFTSGITASSIASSISKSLAAKTIAAFFNDEAIDSYIALKQNGAIKFITNDSLEGLDILRHDAAHLLAQAVRELYPSAQPTIGPVIENGFYYDFAYDAENWALDDLAKIETRMHQIASRGDLIRRIVMRRDEAREFFLKRGESYKAEIIDGINSDEEISFYEQGDFIDLCRGPHAPTTSHLKHFKLTKLSGAYWRGDSRNKMLQRIYGTAFNSAADLANYLEMLKQAELRDHRKLGRELNLFHLQEEAQGSIFWHPKGCQVYLLLEEYIRGKLRQHGYQEVRTPLLINRSLWEKSGHWEKFSEQMFTLETEEQAFALKPMNCPGHVQIFKQGIKSYRDLPLRLAEFGCCHRNEPSGALHGLMRLRNFVQDDAHIFCRPDQIEDETVSFCKLLQEVYRELGFTEIAVKFSDRPIKRAGSDEVWDRAEAALKDGAEAAGLTYTMNHGEGAFYGPKLEFVLKDAIGREWQCGTLQADFVLPERLDAHYINEKGEKERPVMLHRAILGAFERFIGILLEHYAGNLPLWLAPMQAVVASVVTSANDYALSVANRLREHGVRVTEDLSNNKIGYKIREHSAQKIPFILVIGEKEINDNSISVRKFGSNETKTMNLDELVAIKW